MDDDDLYAKVREAIAPNADHARRRGTQAGYADAVLWDASHELMQDHTATISRIVSTAYWMGHTDGFDEGYAQGAYDTKHQDESHGAFVEPYDIGDWFDHAPE